jgi:hypothetical protein
MTRAELMAFAKDAAPCEHGRYMSNAQLAMKHRMSESKVSRLLNGIGSDGMKLIMIMTAHMRNGGYGELNGRGVTNLDIVARIYNRANIGQAIGEVLKEYITEFEIKGNGPPLENYIAISRRDAHAEWAERQTGSST